MHIGMYTSNALRSIGILNSFEIIHFQLFALSFDTLQSHTYQKQYLVESNNKLLQAFVIPMFS